jgi:transcriptional regulator with XRE-family HTH domain
LTQEELAFLLALPDEGPVSRHERLRCTPAFRTAFGYEAVFNVSASKLFPAAFAEISQGVEERLKRLEDQLQSSTAKGRNPVLIARKLEWISERQNLKQPHFY